MKVKKLRDILERLADMQNGLGDGATSQALKELGDVLRVRDREDVAKIVEGIQQRRRLRCTS
jgi:hypothetical protein